MDKEQRLAYMKDRMKHPLRLSASARAQAKQFERELEEEEEDIGEGGEIPVLEAVDDSPASVRTKQKVLTEDEQVRNTATLSPFMVSLQEEAMKAPDRALVKVRKRKKN